MHKSAMEPLVPEIAPLEDLALRLLAGASALGGSLPTKTSRTVAELLRVTNCYYSNRIEGHNTHPADIERAMRNELAEDPTIRTLQREARAHIEVETLVNERLDNDPALQVSRAEFIRWVHRQFYERVPDELRFVADPNTNRREPVIPGELRHHDVRVGTHYPPPFKDVPAFLDRFEEAYPVDGTRSVRTIVAFAASHHRLMWIHPFSDGNGRVIRLFSSSYARRIGLGSCGLWSISRGLARRRADYMSYLGNADSLRRNDYDGRGALSSAALLEFCEFFLDTCLDQVRYMRELLDLEYLGERCLRYAKLRAENAAPGPFKGAPPIREEAGLILRETLMRGEVQRGEAPRMTGLGRTISGQVVKELLDEGLLKSESPKGSLRIGLPNHAVAYLFPQLFPEGIVADFKTSISAA
jgi:Fic family protein